MIVGGELLDKNHWVGVRFKHREKVLQYLREFVSKKDRESLRKLLDELWASEAFQVDMAIERRILAKGFTFEDVAEKLSLAFSNPEKLLDEKIPGFGPASITEILFCIDPERYPIFNKRAVLGLKWLGYEDFEGVYFNKMVYGRFTSVAERFFQDYKAVKEYIESKIGSAIPKFEFVDGVLNLIYEGKVNIQELEELKRQALLRIIPDNAMLDHVFDGVKNAVRQYFYWLEKGDPEDKAIEKAVSYAVGMMASSDVVSDANKRQALVLALEAMARLAEGMADLLKELP